MLDDVRPGFHEPEPLRVPPQAVEAEKSVLGALMLANDALPKVADWLTPQERDRAALAAIHLEANRRRLNKRDKGES